ncbi:T9SS type A sorting domain-containing protein [bacterium]|nr:T9SS type A sorting domain-containing protein [bacterium]
MVYRGLVLTTLLFLFSLSVSAQPWMARFEGMDRTPTLQEKRQAFDEYWQGRPKAKGKGYKQFLRWEWFMESRVNENGYLDPAARWQAWEEKRTMFPPNELDEADWTPLGPFDPDPSYYVGGVGRINCIAFHPTDDNIFYVGAASGGLWKTTDGGINWEPMTDHLPLLGVSSIVVDHTNPNTVYLATGDADANDTYSIGVLKSTDGGVTWNTTGLDWTVTQFTTISKLIMNPDDNQILVAAGSSGIRRTTDGGDTWNVAYNQGNFRDLEVDPDDSEIWYAARSSDGVYKSTNGGASWTRSSSGLPVSGFSRIAIAVAPSNSQRIYALYVNNSSGFFGMYRSDNGGANWTITANSPNLLGYEADGSDGGGQGWYDLTLAVDPSNADVVFVGGINLWKSTDQGISWDIKAHWLGDLFGYDADYMHADQHALEYRGQTLFAGNDGGIYMSPDNGENWTDISYDLAISQAYRVGIYAGGEEVDWLLNGYQDNGTKLKQGDVWTPVLGGDGMECAIDPLNPNYMYGEIYYGNMSRSTNGGDSWVSANSGVFDDGAWVTPFVIDPTSGTLFKGTRRIYRSQNHAGSWTDMSGQISGSTFRAMAISPSDPTVLYAANASEQIMVSTNSGSNWTIHQGPMNRDITYMAVHPINPDVVYATVGQYYDNQKVFVSFNQGEDWTNLSEGLPNLPVNCILVHPVDPQHLYIGTDVGAFFSPDGGESWQDFSTGLPNVIITELELHQPSNTIVAATFGRGTWMTPAEEAQGEPNIVLISPNGGEDLVAGSTVSISWSSMMIEGGIKVEWMPDFPDGNWITIYEDTPNDISEPWVVDGPATTSARVRVSSVMTPALMDTSDADFSVVVPSITITAPNGSEEWVLGETENITWTTENLTGRLVLELNRSFPSENWETVHPNMSDGGTQAWIVNGEPSTTARFRIRSQDLATVMDTSDTDFSIVFVPYITVSEPEEGDLFAIGSELAIRWQDNIGGNVSIDLMNDDDEVVLNVVENTESDGEFDWQISEEVTTGQPMHLLISGLEDEVDGASEDFQFILSQTALLFPEDAVELTEFPVSFSWEAVPGATIYDFEIASDPGFSMETIVHEQDMLETTSAILEALENGTYYWRVRSISSSGVESTSEFNTFTLNVLSVPDDLFSGIPADYSLAAAYPNPFNAIARIVVGLPDVSQLKVTLYNIKGERVAVLADGSNQAGYAELILKADRLASGVYFVRAEVPGKLDSMRKLVLVR